MSWWGIWILCLSPTTNGDLSSSAKAAQYGAVMSPIFTVMSASPSLTSIQLVNRDHHRLLMFGSGIPTAEKPTAKKFYLLSHGPNPQVGAWYNYKTYLQQTSILVPLPPFLYRPIPTFIKKTLLLDFPLYQFDESSDGAAAVEDAAGGQEDG